MYTSLDEATLVARARRGDRSAWAGLYERHRSQILAVCRRYAGDESLAEDHCHEAFLKAMHKIDTFRGESAFGTWLHRIAVNDVLAIKRRRRPENHDGLEDIAVEQTPAREDDLAYRDIVDRLRVRRPALATKLEQHCQFIKDGTWDDLDEEQRKKYRRNMQLVKESVGPQAFTRRAFLAVAAGLSADGIRSAYGVGRLGADELDELVKLVQRRRVDTGEVPVCRALLNRAWASLTPRLENAAACTPGQAQILLRAVDLQIALSLDAFDMQSCSYVLLPRMQRLLPCVRGFSQLGWERRFFQHCARFHFHQEDFATAGQFAKKITGDTFPAASRRRITSDRSGTEAIMTCFEVGSFLGRLDVDTGLDWWRDAYQRLLALGDLVDAARVEAQILRMQAEKTPRDIGPATQATSRLAEIEATQPGILAGPLLQIQHRICRVRCLLIAGLEDEVIHLVTEAAANARRLGYTQGTVRLRRAFRFAAPACRSHLDELVGRC